MLVFCEECGKRYSFPPEKTEPGSANFRCRECGFLMTVNTPPEPAGKAEAQSAEKRPQAQAGNGDG